MLGAVVHTNYDGGVKLPFLVSKGPSEPISIPPCDPRDDDSSASASDSELGQVPPLIDKLNQQPGATSTKYDPNRYAYVFPCPDPPLLREGGGGQIYTQ